MKNLRIILVLIIGISPVALFSCSCAGPLTFCETAVYNNVVCEVEVITKYELTNSHQKYFDLDVKEILWNPKGLTIEDLTLTEQGTSCDIGIHNLFEEGDRLIITFSNIGEDKNANEPTISFFQCGINYLHLKSGFVKGDITMHSDNSDQRMAYPMFRKNVMNLCKLSTISESDITVTPNLTLDLFRIKNDHASALNYSIFDTSGRLLNREKIEATSQQEINIGDYSAGMYFIRFDDDESYVVKKVVKI